VQQREGRKEFNLTLDFVSDGCGQGVDGHLLLHGFFLECILKKILISRKSQKHTFMNGHVYLGVPDVLQVVLVHVAAGDHADHEQVSIDHDQMPEPHRTKETSNRRGKK
jgi:hypothetical protein